MFSGFQILLGLYIFHWMALKYGSPEWRSGLRFSARGVTIGPGSNPGCITSGSDWESYRAAHIWPSVVRIWPEQAVNVNKNLFLSDFPS
jgi:hypothetical protein